MTYPPTTPGGWQDPTSGTPDPAPQQPTYIDPISGQPATVANPATYPAPTTAPGYPSAYPAYGAPEQTYGQPAYAQPAYGQPAYGQPGYAQPGYPQYPGYPGYPGYPATALAVSQKTNGLSIASLVISLCGVVFLLCYGGGAVLGLLGAILGHVARGQIRNRNEGGGGMAMAGIIVGWITVALGAIIIGVVAWAIANYSNSTTY